MKCQAHFRAIWTVCRHPVPVKGCGQKENGDQRNAPVQNKQSEADKNNFQQDFPKQGQHLKVAGFDHVGFVGVFRHIFSLLLFFIGDVVLPDDAGKNIVFQKPGASHRKPRAHSLVAVVEQHFAENKPDQQKGIPEGCRCIPRHGIVQNIALEELQHNRKNRADEYKNQSPSNRRCSFADIFSF